MRYIKATLLLIIFLWSCEEGPEQFSEEGPKQYSVEYRVWSSPSHTTSILYMNRNAEPDSTLFQSEAWGNPWAYSFKAEKGATLFLRVYTSSDYPISSSGARIYVDGDVVAEKFVSIVDSEECEYVSSNLGPSRCTYELVERIY